MIGAAAMNISPAVLDQAVGLLDLIALVRDPEKSKAILEGFVAERKAAEKARADASAAEKQAHQVADGHAQAAQKAQDAEAKAKKALDEVERESQKLSDARDDLERGRDDLKASLAAMTSQLQAANIDRGRAADALRERQEAVDRQEEALRQERKAFDVRCTELETKEADLNERLSKLRQLAG